MPFKARITPFIIGESLPILKSTDCKNEKENTKFIRLPESMIEELKVLANKRDVPYQSLLKIFISERIDAELHH